MNNDATKIGWAQFDDDKAMTVDIYVTWKGVQFTNVDDRTTVIPLIRGSHRRRERQSKIALQTIRRTLE